jgi:hypothetical protein
MRSREPSRQRPAAAIPLRPTRRAALPEPWVGLSGVASRAVPRRSVSHVTGPAKATRLMQRESRSQQARSHVVELGGGTGANLHFYNGTQAITLTEPDKPMMRRLAEPLPNRCAARSGRGPAVPGRSLRRVRLQPRAPLWARLLSRTRSIAATRPMPRVAAVSTITVTPLTFTLDPPGSGAAR